MRPKPVPEPSDSATADLRLAFERMLPRRAEALARRGRLFCAEGWDINGLLLLHEDVQRLTGAAGTYGLLETSQALLRLEQVLADFVNQERLPDAGASARIQVMFEGLGAALPTPPPSSATPAPGAGPRIVGEVQAEPLRGEAPPDHYWRRWGGDAPPPVAIASRTTAAAARAAPPAPVAEPVVPILAPVPPVEAEPRRTRVARAPAAREPALVPAPAEAPSGLADDAARLAAARRVGGAAPITQVRAKAAAAERRGRVYHLSDGGALACELDQKLEALGYELEILDDPAELCEVLAALPPDLVVINSGFLGELEGVGEALRESRRRTAARIPLLALAEIDSVQGRLSARRAGADAFLPAVNNADEVVGRIADLLSPEREEAYRIMVVEDDRSQALFAESILRKAGMEVRVVCDAMEVIDAIEQFSPDLILMDLHMPAVDGAELTSLIREREADIATPIVFLSGEADTEKQLEALTAGGDDFLSKPIRPKHLIAAVTNRVRRARALLRQGAAVAPDPRDAETGLYRRGFVIDRINEALAEEDVRERDGGVLYLEVDGAVALRERLGLTALEQLMVDVARRLALELREFDLAARYSEGSFFLLAPARGDGELESLAQALRNALAAHAFKAEGRPLRLRVMVGVCPLRFGFADAGAVLNTAERACREARRSAQGVHLFSPSRPGGEEAQAALLERLRHAIERDAFDLLYQPIVPLQGGEEAQYQTLVRLRDEVGRVYTAAEIVPLARSAGLILDVDRWVLSHALDIAARRQREQRPVRLFVSQSAQSLCTADQAEWMIAQLAARGVGGDRIAIELPLTELADNEKAIDRFCRALLPAGVHLCLSQFESGLLGDSLLEQLPIDFLKLAPRYLAAAQAQGVRDELMLTIERAHRRNISVIAHRVEDAQSAATLWIAGIDYIQGNMVQQAGDGLDFDFQTAVL